jgi:hypothetical protein
MAHETTSPRSRRALLAGGLGGLVAVVAQAFRPLSARAEGETIHVGDNHFTAETATWLKNTSTNNDVFRAQTLGKGRGMFARSDGGTALEAVSGAYKAVQATSDSWIAVSASGPEGGVQAAAVRGHGVHGVSDAGNGVFGRSIRAVGVLGISQQHVGVKGESGAADLPSVHAVKRVAGPAVFGEVMDAGSQSAAVLGVNAGTGAGIRGRSAHGRGGVFEGGGAQLRLVPSGDEEHPATGYRGDLFVDQSCRLWFCKGGTAWVQLV